MMLAKKRSPLVAGLLTAFLGGVGFLYLGKWRWAIILTVLPYLMLISCTWTKLIFIPNMIFFFLILFILSLLIPIIIAVRTARHIGSMPLLRFQRWYVYLGYLVLTTIVSEAFMHHRGQILGYESFHIPTQAMNDTLQQGDYLTSNTWKFKNHAPQRGDVIIFRYPIKPEIKYIKRVIGLPNDVVKIEDNTVSINGVVLKEPYVNPNNNLGRGIKDAEYKVPDNQYFVLGDNRDHSADSRDFGFVPAANLYGSAEYIWLTYNAKDGLRTDRIGQVIK